MLVYIKRLISNKIHYTRCKWNFSNSSAVQNSVKVVWDRDCIWRHVGDLTHSHVFKWNFAATLSAKISLASAAKGTNPAFSKKKQNHRQKSQKITVNTSHTHIPPASQQEFSKFLLGFPTNCKILAGSAMEVFNWLSNFPIKSSPWKASQKLGILPVTTLRDMEHRNQSTKDIKKGEAWLDFSNAQHKIHQRRLLKQNAPPNSLLLRFLMQP